MSLSIAEKTAVVTGAANGVGLSIARHFLKEGAKVMLADMDETRLSKEVNDIDEGSESAACFAGDLREKLTVANLLSATIDRFDRVDILVNASRQVVTGDPLNANDDGVQMLIEQNLMTSLRVSQIFAKRMIKQAEGGNGETPAGSIINLSSIAARRSQPKLLAYSVSSAALDQMTRALAVALAPHRIRVNAIAFGSVMSASLKDALDGNNGMRNEIISSTPLGRIARPTELAEVAQFLASDGSDFVTGQILTADGGRTLVDGADAPAH